MSDANHSNFQPEFPNYQFEFLAALVIVNKEENLLMLENFLPALITPLEYFNNIRSPLHVGVRSSHKCWHHISNQDHLGCFGDHCEHSAQGQFWGVWGDTWITCGASSYRNVGQVASGLCSFWGKTCSVISLSYFQHDQQTRFISLYQTLFFFYTHCTSQWNGVTGVLITFP